MRNAVPKWARVQTKRTTERRERTPRERTKAVFLFQDLHWAGVEQWLVSLLAGLRRTTIDARVCVDGGCDPVTRQAIEQHAQLYLGRDCAQCRDADVVALWSVRNCPTWLVDYTGPIVGMSHGCGDWWMREASAWVDHWAAVSNVAAVPCPGPATVIHNGVDEVRLRPTMTSEAARESLRLRPDDVGVGIIARLSAEKQHHEAINRWGEVPECYRLVLVGSGPREAELREFARPYGDRVIFAGRRDDVANVYAGLDATALLSAHEGFALAIVESLLCGLPTIATPVGAVRELPEILCGPQPCHVVHDMDSFPWIVVHAIGRPYKRGPNDRLDYLTADAMAGRWARYLSRL